ncbi:MAG: HdeD family acid-resistance protein [Acetobacteraceae bacterium]|nr:HdeD family acid-resistance protein [Acetobacteraceae bacterium]
MSWTSGTLPTAGPAGVAHHRWGWFVGLGILLILLGVVAWFEVVLLGLAGVLFLGAMMLVGGIFQIIQTFSVRGWRGFLLSLLMGIVYVIAGVIIMREPLTGAFVLTLFLAACLLVGGIFRIVLAVQHRELPGWWVMVLSGIVSVVIAFLLYVLLANAPWSSLVVIGTLIAVELVILGFTYTSFGLTLRRTKSA